MPVKNSLTIGFLFGSIAPLIAWVIFEYVLHNDAILLNKPAAPYLIAISLNLLMVRYGYKKGLDRSANGVMMVTFAFMLVVFIFKVHLSR